MKILSKKRREQVAKIITKNGGENVAVSTNGAWATIRGIAVDGRLGKDYKSGAAIFGWTLNRKTNSPIRAGGEIYTYSHCYDEKFTGVEHALKNAIARLP